MLLHDLFFILTIYPDAVFYEVYCFLINILGQEYYSDVSLLSNYTWDILFIQVY